MDGWMDGVGRHMEREMLARISIRKDGHRL